MEKKQYPNELGTYKVINQEGKVVETFRLKASANYFLEKNRGLSYKIIETQKGL